MFGIFTEYINETQLSFVNLLMEFNEKMDPEFERLVDEIDMQLRMHPEYEVVKNLLKVVNPFNSFERMKC